MSDINEYTDNLPPGWECRFDGRSGRFYFINHITRTTSWTDPRIRRVPLSATPNYHNMPTEHIQMQEFRSNQRSSPLSVRGNRVQDSSLTIQQDTEESVASISAMFPTVSDTHIRMLMKNCRYMKSIFPDAEETLILEILQNNENNIQMTSDILKDMGYDKKDTVKTSKQKMIAKKEAMDKLEEDKKEKEPEPVPILKTVEEKQAIKDQLKQKYKDVAEHLIQIALESVGFDESRANQILQSMVQEDKEKSEQTNVGKVEEPKEKTEVQSAVPTTIPISQSRMSIKSLLKSEKNDKDISPYNRIIEEEEYNKGYRSIYLSNTRGPNSEIKKGANENLLLEDYVKWQGPNSNYSKGPQGLAKGPNQSLRSARTYTPQGPNPELRKGPKLSIAKGSIFSQFKAVFEGESRGK